jgi:hypothetical protein
VGVFAAGIIKGPGGPPGGPAPAPEPEKVESEIVKGPGGPPNFALYVLNAPDSN